MPDLAARLATLRETPVIGNAYSDHDLLSALYTLTDDALVAGRPDVAYDALDVVGIDVMGEPPMAGWDEFIAVVAEVYHPRTGMLADPHHPCRPRS